MASVDRHDILRLVGATTDSVEQERRLRRIEVSCDVSIESGDMKLNGTTLDISFGGMFAQASGSLPAGALTQVAIHVSKQRAAGIPSTPDSRKIRLVAALSQRHGLMAAKTVC